jgi:hypothetical protein
MSSNVASRWTFSVISHEQHVHIINRKPSRLCRILQVTYGHQNIVGTHKIDMIRWNERLHSRSLPTTQCTYIQRLDTVHFFAMETKLRNLWAFIHNYKTHTYTCIYIWKDRRTDRGNVGRPNCKRCSRTWVENLENNGKKASVLILGGFWS